MKRHTAKQYAAALYEATKDVKGEALDAALKAFAGILKRERALRLFDLVLREYELYAKKQLGEVTLSVTTKVPLSSGNKKMLMEIFSGTTEIKEVADPTILGGMKVREGDVVYDGTVRTQLLKLRNRLLA